MMRLEGHKDDEEMENENGKQMEGENVENK
jgi:hypothetical protein